MGWTSATMERGADEDSERWFDLELEQTWRR